MHHSFISSTFLSIIVYITMMMMMVMSFVCFCSVVDWQKKNKNVMPCHDNNNTEDEQKKNRTFKPDNPFEMNKWSKHLTIVCMCVCAIWNCNNNNNNNRIQNNKLLSLSFFFINDNDHKLVEMSKFFFLDIFPA